MALLTYILLFRGINVGGRNLVRMPVLKNLLHELGYSQVQSYIQSGNVVLRGGKKPGTDLIAAIESVAGFKADLMVLDESAFVKAAKENPFSSRVTTGEGKYVHLYFCNTLPKPDNEKLATLAAPTEEYALKEKVFYLYAPDGLGKSKLVAGIEKCLGVPATGRNLNTIHKIQDMLEEADKT